MEIRAGLLESLARKWWFYLLLFLLSFTPPYTSKPYDPSEIQRIIAEVLNLSLMPYRRLAPIFHLATIALVISLFTLGDRAIRAFDAYVSINYFFIAFAQGIAHTEYGLSVLFGNIVCLLIVGIYWAWEALVRKNEFNPRNVPFWKYWVVPLAILAFWSPLKPEFKPAYLLTSYYGLAFCLTTPVFLSIVSLCQKFNVATLRVTSFMGALFGVISIALALMEGYIWSGVLHIPLLVISLYCLVLSMKMSR